MSHNRITLGRISYLFLALVLMAGLMLDTGIASVMRAATPIYVNVATGNDTWDGQAPAWDGIHGPKKTIQAGINVVDPGGTVYVAAGTYQENASSSVDININKSLSLIGSGSSSTIVELNEYNNPAGTHMTGVRISASNVSIQGIKLTKQSGASYGCAYNIHANGSLSNITFTDVESEYSYLYGMIFDGAGPYQNVTITNCNVHHSYSDRCFYQSPATTINTLTVTNSHFDYAGYGSPGPDPIGFNLQGTTTNLTITGGTFSHNVHEGICIGQVTNAVIQDVVVNNSGVGKRFRAGIMIWDQTQGSSNIQIINPTVTNCGGRGILIGTLEKTLTGVTVTGGTITGSGNEGIAIVASGTTGGSVTGVTLDGVTVTGNPINVFVVETGNATCTNVTIKNSTIANATDGGVFFSCADVTGSAVNFNAIVGNTTYGVNGNISHNLDTTNNWWGCNYGPGQNGTGCSAPTNRIIGTVNTDPWLVLDLDAPAFAAVGGGTATLTADLTKNSNASDISYLGHVPDGTTATFGGTMGSVAPSVTGTAAGKATSTFTAGATPGTAIVSVTVDDQTVTDTITIGMPTVQFAYSAYVVQEDAGTATIDASLNVAPVQAVTVDYATSDGTAQADTDYITSTGTLTFTPGQASQTFTVTILADAVSEQAETVILTLSNPNNANMGTINPATLMIMDTVHSLYLPLALRNY